MDLDYRNDILFPKIFEDLLKNSKIIFFTNAWYFTIAQLRKAKKIGFKIIQLNVGLDILKERNLERRKTNYDDLEPYLAGMVEYQKHVREKGLIDYELNGENQTNKVAEDLLEIVKE
jgi:hypothetical protein